MAQIGISGNLQEWYGLNPTFNQVTVLPTGRNLKTWWNFEDFIHEGLAAGAGIWYPFYGGAGAYLLDDAGTAVRPGIVSLLTGTTAAGYATIWNAQQTLGPFLFGAGIYTIEGDIYIPLLSTAIEEFTTRFGFLDVVAADAVDGAYFEYDRTANVNWLRCTSNNSVRTKTDTGIAVAAGAWIRLKVVVNANATSVEFFINGVSVGANVLNIPSAGGRETTGMLQIIKSVGITSRILRSDWIWEHFDLTTSR